MAKVIVIENLEERNIVRSVFKNAHCRPVKIGKGFCVFYMNGKKEVILGFDEETRAGAWREAAEEVNDRILNKLES
jgi:hypothetical protein